MKNVEGCIERRAFYYDGSFESALHGGHYFLIKVGAMPNDYRGQWYPGIGPSYQGRLVDEKRHGWWRDYEMIWIDPCVEEKELVSWLEHGVPGSWGPKVRDAIELAKRVYLEQKRDGDAPYLEQHIYPVTLTVERAIAEARLPQKRRRENRRHAPRLYASEEEIGNAIIIALLHDSIEHRHLPEKLLKRKISEEFGSFVYDAVNILTRKREEEEEYVKRLIASPWQVRAVKLAERMNNLFSLQYTTEEKRKEYLEKTAKYYLHLADATPEFFYFEWMRETLKLMGVDESKLKIPEVER